MVCDLRPYLGAGRAAYVAVVARVERLRAQLADSRGNRVVFCSHCLLNENVRYLGGAGRTAGVDEVIDSYLRRGIGIVQMPCPEQHAWGGVLKRRMLMAYGASGILRGAAARIGVRPFVWYTRLVYTRLGRRIAAQVADYRRSGVDVVGIVGVGGSPSCGVATTLDLVGAVRALTHCPLQALDRDVVNRQVVAANLTPGTGLFIRSVRRHLNRRGLHVNFLEHDLLSEIRGALGDFPAPADGQSRSRGWASRSRS